MGIRYNTWRKKTMSEYKITINEKIIIDLEKQIETIIQTAYSPTAIISDKKMVEVKNILLKLLESRNE
jgi:hypothetical protein